MRSLVEPDASLQVFVERLVARAVAKDYMSATGRPWTQPIGFVHALFELAIDSLKRSADPTDPKANVAAIAAADLQSIVGPIKFGDKRLPPFAQKNIAKTPLVGGQWRLGGDGKYQVVIVDNQSAPAIPVGGRMEPIGR